MNGRHSQLFHITYRNIGGLISRTVRVHAYDMEEALARFREAYPAAELVNIVSKRFTTDDLIDPKVAERGAM